MEYGFTVEYDRQLTINLPGAPSPAYDSAAPATPAAEIPKARKLFRVEFEQMLRTKMAH